MACSGFIVSVARGEVMTVAHCVKPQGPLTVDGQTAELIRKDEAFALLKIEPFSGKPALEISEGEVSIAQSVAASGWAYGEILVYIPRAVIGKDKGDFAMNGVIVPGMSGGPVVDASGLVVGINQASTDALGIACGAREIRDFLKGR
jgi:S1-C subfamily serine protease